MTITAKSSKVRLDAAEQVRIPEVISFSAIVLSGLALVAPAAHLLEMPHKIGLAENEYFLVQSIYSGWWMAGLLLPAAFVANLALAVVRRGDATACTLSLIAAALIAVNLGVFFLWTQPANSATANWTLHPQNWRQLRQQWEYSHAINATILFVAFCMTTLACLRDRQRT